MSPSANIGPPNEHDVVKLKHPLHTKDYAEIHEILLAAGTTGTIVYIGELPGQPTAYLVEFCDAGGITLAMPWLHRWDFEIIWRCRDDGAGPNMAGHQSTECLVSNNVAAHRPPLWRGPLLRRHLDQQPYKGRNVVERSFALLKQWRALATR